MDNMDTLKATVNRWMRKKKLGSSFHTCSDHHSIFVWDQHSIFVWDQHSIFVWDHYSIFVGIIIPFLFGSSFHLCWDHHSMFAGIIIPFFWGSLFHFSRERLSAGFFQ